MQLVCEVEILRDVRNLCWVHGHGRRRKSEYIFVIRRQVIYIYVPESFEDSEKTLRPCQ